ncbi:Lin1244/Lin1753 domain-containing protein [Paenibacillus sp. EC2-1]|uniref:Lin1244/Lin1753 domain-containing protein n=1 Tax=Paenibacillus sp. EC2-1 TaxID=3388665 RepID=UPI003BEF4558
MARPLKESLDYFPLDIDFDRDDKLVVVIGKYGMQGLGIIVKIMMEIYRNGYFYAWGEREQYAFSNRINVDINTIRDVINECIKWDFFNQELYENHNVLTSKGFQKRFIEAAKRRKIISILEDFLLIDPDKESEKVSHSIVIVNVNGNIVNEYINPIKRDKMSAETPQSKVKESKVKKSKVIIKEEEEGEERAFAQVVDFYTRNIGQMPPSQYEYVKDWLKTFDQEVLKLAIRCAVDNGAFKWSYVNQTLVEWERKGAKALNDCEALILEFKRQKVEHSSKRRNGGFAKGEKKPGIPIVDNSSAMSVNDAEYEEMMKLAEEMQTSKGGR